MESNAIFLIKEKGICLWYNLIWIVVFKFDKGINSLWVWKVLLLTGPLDQGLILLLLFRLSLPCLSPSSFLARFFRIGWVLFSPQSTCLGCLSPCWNNWDCVSKMEFRQLIYVRCGWCFSVEKPKKLACFVFFITLAHPHPPASSLSHLNLVTFSCFQSLGWPLQLWSLNSENTNKK